MSARREYLKEKPNLGPTAPLKLENDAVEEAITQSIRDLLGPNRAFSLADHFVFDLKIDGDDLSFYFIPKVEEALGVSVPAEEWSSVGTGLETAAMLRRHLPRPTAR